MKSSIKKLDSSMLTGNIWYSILYFAFPLVIGNLFQQLYNTADSVIVGQFVGKEALAAVGSSNSLINLLVGIFTGVAVGAGVIISQYYGAKQFDKLKIAIQTALLLSIIGGILLIVAGLFLSPIILSFIETPTDILPNSILYLRIFFIGSLFNLFYNMGAGILRAIGNSSYPVICLAIASIVNIVLDYLFVGVFQFGIAGAGYATITAQGVSALLILLKFKKAGENQILSIKRLKLDKPMASRILKVGIPSGIQGSIISVSNVIVQSNINVFGTDVVAGCGSYSKIDGFVILPIMSFSMAAMTFAGQNLGAGKLDRIKSCVKITLIMSLCYILFVSFLLINFGDNIIQVFNKDSQVVYYGMKMLKILLPFYWAVTTVNVLTSVFRGTGKTLVSMCIMMLNLCGVRMLWVHIMQIWSPFIDTVLWGYPISWMTGTLCAALYMWKGNWLPKKGVLF